MIPASHGWRCDVVFGGRNTSLTLDSWSLGWAPQLSTNIRMWRFCGFILALSRSSHSVVCVSKICIVCVGKIIALWQSLAPVVNDVSWHLGSLPSQHGQLDVVTLQPAFQPAIGCCEVVMIHLDRQHHRFLINHS